MELKPGYKQSDVGVIPEEWEAKAIGTDIDLLTGFPFPSSGYANSGIRLLRGSNVKRGQTDWADEITQYWPAVTHDIARYALSEGDLVIAMDGSLVGRSYAQLKPEDLPALLLQRVARIRSTNLDVGYLTAFVGSDRFIRYADSVKTVTAIPHISPADIRGFWIPVPLTVEEQRAIAGALEDVDALLGALTRLIAKKRDLKQAAMQQLLTGQTRLPGFSGEWEVKWLGEVSSVNSDSLSADTPSHYEFTYISLEDVDTGVLRTHSEQVLVSAPSRARRRLKHGDILVSTVRPNLRSHLLFTRDEPHWICSTGFSVVRCISGVALPAYVFFHMFGNAVSRQIDTLLTGSNYPAINGGDVKALQVPMPSIEEQTAIATVLSDMDAEIAALEARLAKTRALKQGMMQELLTGRTRLV